MRNIFFLAPNPAAMRDYSFAGDNELREDGSNLSSVLAKLCKQEQMKQSLLDFIRSLISPPLVIFTTAYSEYAVDGFKLDAVDYLLKPFEFQDLLKAADKARKQFEYKLLEQQSELGNASQVKGDSLFVKSDCRVVRIDINNIRYIEGMSEYVRIFVEGENKPVITLASLQKMEERLPAHFMRVHRSYIVNLRKITEISRLRIIFDKNTYIPVGDNYKERFTEFISKLSFS